MIMQRWATNISHFHCSKFRTCLTHRHQRSPRLLYDRYFTTLPRIDQEIRKLCLNRYHAPRTGRYVLQQSRYLFLDSIPTILLPPVAFLGLLVALWTYKCMMMVLFQDKIIYMPYVPPFSRSERVEDYVSKCKPIEWETKRIRSLDNTKIAICIGQTCQGNVTSLLTRKHVVICYFQGNGSSLPPRLPMLSNILKLIETRQSEETQANVSYTLVALSYRGYWISSGRASQTGIELDARSLLSWVETQYTKPDTQLDVILWGQSIGAGVASTLAAAHILESEKSGRRLVRGLILETPFSNIRSMLSAMYPQKWLPYGYLWPFLWNHWDSDASLRRIAQYKHRPSVLLISASKDEIVPQSETRLLEDSCKYLGLQYERRNVAGALHTEATMRKSGQDAVARYVVRLSAVE